MVLAWRRLRIHHCHHWCALAELSGEVGRTFAHVIVDAVDATSAILTHVILAVVNVLGAVDASKAGRTVARVVGEVVDALCVVRARIELTSAELDFLLAELAGEARKATACVRLDAIDAGSVVLTFVVVAIVDVDFTASAFVARQTIATEATFLQHGARSVIPARISVASINHVLAVLTVVARSTSAFVLSFRSHRALGVVLAWECEAGIAFRQDFITDRLLADELVGGR